MLAAVAEPSRTEGAMTSITRDVLESYIACEYKAYLKLAEQADGTKGRHTTPFGDSQYPSQLAGPVRTPFRADENAIPVRLTSSCLRKAKHHILNILFETDTVSIHIEGLQRVEGSSSLGDFHYLPLVFKTGSDTDEAQRMLLDVYGSILSRLQGRVPAKGVIWTDERKSSTVQLSPGARRGERILNTVNEIQKSDQKPVLILNKHCQICEFRKRCLAQAVEEDNLSLLQGISKAEILRLRKKGIFTITQLSYTFKPRGKKAGKEPGSPSLLCATSTCAS